MCFFQSNWSSQIIIIIFFSFVFVFVFVFVFCFVLFFFFILISRSSSFAVFHVNVDIQKQSKERLGFVLVVFFSLCPGACILQRPFLKGLFLEGLIYGRKLAFQNRLGYSSLIVGSKFIVFALFYFVFEGNFPSTSSRGAHFGRAYTWRLSFGILRQITRFSYPWCSASRSQEL